MRRLVGLVLVGALAFTFVGTSASRAATISSTWPVGHNPTGVAVDPVDGRVYVANEGTTMLDGSGRVFVVDPASGAVSQIPTSGASDLVALDVASRRLYSSNTNRTVDVIDLATQGIVATLPVGGLGIAVDETTHCVYVAGGRDIALIDGTTNSVLATQLAPAGQSWFGLAHNPALHQVYVTNINQPGQSVVILDDQSLAVLDEIALPFPARFALGVDPARGLIYVGSYDGFGGFANSALYVIDANAPHALVHTTPLAGAFPSHLVVAPANQRVYVMDMNGRRLFEVDDSSFVVSEVTGLPWQPGWAALHPDGRLYVGGWSADLLAALQVQATNAAPSVTVSLSSSSPKTNDVLTATAVGSDVDGDTLTYTYTWTVNGVVKRTTTTAATTDGFNLKVKGNGDKGDVVKVSVTASDGAATSTAATASATVR
jgi:DNA-binding beta-propeller fold protein YncE